MYEWVFFWVLYFAGLFRVLGWVVVMMVVVVLDVMWTLTDSRFLDWNGRLRFTRRNSFMHSTFRSRKVADGRGQ